MTTLFLCGPPASSPSADVDGSFRCGRLFRRPTRPTNQGEGGQRERWNMSQVCPPPRGTTGHFRFSGALAPGAASRERFGVADTLVLLLLKLTRCAGADEGALPRMCDPSGADHGHLEVHVRSMLHRGDHRYLPRPPRFVPGVARKRTPLIQTRHRGVERGTSEGAGFAYRCSTLPHGLRRGLVKNPHVDNPSDPAVGNLIRKGN